MKFGIGPKIAQVLAAVCLVITFAYPQITHADLDPKWGTEFSLTWGTGRQFNSSQGLPDFSGMGLSIDMLMGVRFPSWILGVFLEARFSKQITASEETGGVRSYREGTTFGIGHGFHIRKFYGQIGLMPLGSYKSYEEVVSSRQLSDYKLKSPFIIRVMLGYEIFPALLASISYRWHQFRTIERGGIPERDISSSPMTGKELGIGLTVIY